MRPAIGAQGTVRIDSRLDAGLFCTVSVGGQEFRGGCPEMLNPWSICGYLDAKLLSTVGIGGQEFGCEHPAHMPWKPGVKPGWD